MKIIRIIALSFCFLQVIRAQNIPGQEKIRIDPSAAMGGTVSQYIDSVEFIPFESTPKSTFGNIDQLEMTDNYFLILDRETTSLLIFTKQGQFHAKIEGQKVNPQQPNFYNFNFDKKTNLIEINFISKICLFNLDGKLAFQRSASLDKYMGIKTGLGDKFSGYYFYSPWKPYTKNDSIGYELTVMEEGRLLRKYLPFRINLKYRESGGSQLHTDFFPDPAANDSAVWFTRDYDYSVYRLTPHTLEAPYLFIFPLSKSLPKNFRTDSVFDNKRSQYIKENKVVIYKVVNFYKYADNLLFKTITNSFSGSSLIYNLGSHHLVAIDKIVSDARSYFLPITDAEAGGLDFSSRGIIQYDGENFYTSCTSLILFYQKEATKTKNPSYPAPLNAYLNNKQNMKSNPVLVRIRFKPDL